MHATMSNPKRVTDIMAEITAASQEQTSGIEQINQATTQMDQVTQQNAALVEEAAAAASSPCRSRRAIKALLQSRLAVATPSAAGNWEEF